MFHFCVLGVLSLHWVANSDHSGIQVELYAKQLLASKVNRKQIYFDRGDYAKMKRIIDSSNSNLYVSEDISSSVLMWQKTSIMEQCIPKHINTLLTVADYKSLLKKRNLLF